mmetsp:Transcript_23361/g.31291  ORF Transcript_23361/g.31291 Transcript_23361/m.31291 type:complete len:92 (+) Transcript_23361:891-1166(+)|eukprot:CAMPEP_0185569792 /NCGR_PEP_ID=MMETSP0434-20130131/2310_1 /TAXON_ID=626734 ORGANISM="Favella taraikaensis, Strain Fe Narragansett Bay" /NCGR_SAMPLE_ID=MMETSP0434 /ASSEMBLY_ACC=CAM_ASM_000379 /LENGTH=91 /DNA_ID=CAMNT_0028184701 /DNA_START=824 /DNA_END=1099 /DNA_ORIENTATION=-
MKQLFDALFYKVRVRSDVSEDVAAWNPENYLFEQQKSLYGQNYKLVDHPADSFIDYNSMVDNLEEEHLRRDVFTTATENTTSRSAAMSKRQ